MDTVALGKFMRTVESWVDTPMNDSELESEHEGGEEDEDDEDNEGGSRAGSAPAQAQSAWKKSMKMISPLQLTWDDS